MRDFLPRVTLETHPMNANSSDLAAQEPALVTIHLRNGQELHERVDIAKGMPARPFSRADLTGKFHNLASPVYGSSKSAQILSLLYEFTHQDALPTLMRQLLRESK